MTLFDHIKSVLEQNESFCKDGNLFKNKVVEAGLKLDPELLKLLLKDDKAKKHFFTAVDGIAVFDKTKFQKFVSNKQFLPDSFTAFKNKIGLTANGEYLTEANEVVLDFPYKDCVLEGGQTKEDQKRQEIFWNETLAPDEIDRLFEPKVLTNFKKYSSDGVEEVNEISDKDNLIIKGNNLIALHSLKKVFENKIKMIFIDPPYNTENDSFRYNDSFNHSTWLTFMRNRVEVARTLLSPDGLFWVSLSDKEAHYFKVLTDEIFGRENFVADVIWNSTKSVTNTAVISDAHTHILLYAKNINNLKTNRTDFRLAADESKFSNPDNDPRGKWVADPFQVGGVRPNQLYEIVNPNTGTVYTPNPGGSWKNEKKVFDKLLEDGRIVFGASGDAGPQRKRFWSEAKERGQVTTTLWKDLPTTTNGTKHLKDLFSKKVFDNPKPEGLMERIIQLSTNQGDLILDFNLGSGTTATSAHKMKRQYIGIEQMDYINEVSVERLKKVIEGEQGGISKNQEWQGGGSFIYCELMNNSNDLVTLIKSASDKPSLSKLIPSIDNAFLNFNVGKSHLAKVKTLLDDLEINEAKNVLISLIDKNNLYVSIYDMEDSTYSLNEKTLKFNRLFYKI